MGNYVEKNIGINEQLIKKATFNKMFLVWMWIKGILFFWLLLIPTIKAIISTVKFTHMELAVTNKRIVGKIGVFNTTALDSPLDKIQNVSVEQTLVGKIFNYSILCINTAAGSYVFEAVKGGDAFKGMIMAQIDKYQEDLITQQANKMAQAMAGVINK